MSIPYKFFYKTDEDEVFSVLPLSLKSSLTQPDEVLVSLPLTPLTDLLAAKVNDYFLISDHSLVAHRNPTAFVY